MFPALILVVGANLFATLIASIIVALWVWWLTPCPEPPASVAALVRDLPTAGAGRRMTVPVIGLASPPPPRHDAAARRPPSRNSLADVIARAARPRIVDLASRLGHPWAFHSRGPDP